MASSYSTDLKLELMVTGENAGTWGDKTNTNLNLVQQAIAGVESIALTDGGNVTLVMSDAAISNARNMVLKLTGTLTGASTLSIPDSIEKFYIIDATSVTGPTNLTIKTVSGSGFTLDQAKIYACYSNGTDVTEVSLDTLGGSIGTAGILDNAITSAKISANQITTAKISDNQITTAKISDNQITTAKISDNQITTAKISDNQITAAKISDNQILAAKLSTDVITGQTVETSVDDASDLVLIYDNSATALRKMTVANLVANAGGGKVLQVVQATSTTTVTVNHTTSYTDLFTASITPTSATSKVLIIAAITGSSASGSVRSYLELTRATTAIFSGTSVGSRVACSSIFQIPYGMNDTNITYLDSPATTSSTTYRIRTRMGPSDIGDTYMNRTSADSDNGNHPRGTSSITLIEIGA